MFIDVDNRQTDRKDYFSYYGCLLHWTSYCDYQYYPEK